jgi:hypothetical protein
MRISGMRVVWRAGGRQSGAGGASAVTVTDERDRFFFCCSLLLLLTSSSSSFFFGSLLFRRGRDPTRRLTHTHTHTHTYTHTLSLSLSLAREFALHPPPPLHAHFVPTTQPPHPPPPQDSAQPRPKMRASLSLGAAALVVVADLLCGGPAPASAFVVPSALLPQQQQAAKARTRGVVSPPWSVAVESNRWKCIDCIIHRAGVDRSNVSLSRIYLGPNLGSTNRPTSPPHPFFVS